MTVVRTPEGYLDTAIPNSANVTRITSADSPYEMRVLDKNLFCDTSDGNIIVNLPAGQAGEGHRIINTGSVTNRVTVNPDGADLLLGTNSSIDVLDGDVVIMAFEPTEGWW